MVVDCPVLPDIYVVGRYSELGRSYATMIRITSSLSDCNELQNAKGPRDLNIILLIWFDDS